VALEPQTRVQGVLWVALDMKRRTEKRFVTPERQPLGRSTQVNQVLAPDFMRDTLYDGRPFRTLNVIDGGNREALPLRFGTSIPSARLVRAMNKYTVRPRRFERTMALK
jgi:putative transposase